MTFIDAALTVLARSDEPMTAHQVFDAAVALGLIESGGRTPFATMLSRLYIEANSDSPRIRKLSLPGPSRARRGSVRWTLADRQSPAAEAEGEVPSREG